MARYPWERLNNEPQRAFIAFTIYRDAGPDRSIRDTARKLKDQGFKRVKPYASCRLWATEFRWDERVAAWIDHLDREKCKGKIDEIRTATERQIKIAELLQMKAIKKLQSIDPDELTAREALVLVESGIRIERIARQMDTAIEDRTQQRNIEISLDMIQDEIKRIEDWQPRQAVDDGVIEISTNLPAVPTGGNDAPADGN